MKKAITGLVVGGATVLGSLVAPAPAQAYPVEPPPSENVSPATVESGPATSTTVSSTSASLPATGGPDGLLLGGGAALVLAGGAVVVASRRRRVES